VLWGNNITPPNSSPSKLQSHFIKKRGKNWENRKIRKKIGNQNRKKRKEKETKRNIQYEEFG